MFLHSHQAETFVIILALILIHLLQTIQHLRIEPLLDVPESQIFKLLNGLTLSLSDLIGKKFLQIQKQIESVGANVEL